MISLERPTSLRLFAGVVLLLTAVGCYPSNVLEDRDRSVQIGVDERKWGPVDRGAFPGAYASESISGPAAASLLEIRYVFVAGAEQAGGEGAADEGGYTGAGLVAGDDGLHYQTLDGVWRLEAGKLVLDDVPPGVDVEAAGDYLRLSTAQGVVVLRRFEFD